MRFTAKAVAPVGTRLTVTEEISKKDYLGTVHQANSDGNMIVLIDGLPHPKWVTAPPAPAPVAPAPVTPAEGAAMLAEILRLQHIIAALNEQLADKAKSENPANVPPNSSTPEESSSAPQPVTSSATEPTKPAKPGARAAAAT